MNSSRLVVALIPLLAAACGGTTINIETTPADAGKAPIAQDSGVGVPPVGVDAGPVGPSPFDAGPVQLDAGGPMFDAGAAAVCMTNSDCAAGEQCLWPTSLDVCIAFNPLGSCLPIGPLCNSLPRTSIGCGCYGKDVTWQWGCNGVPQGYAPFGIAHDGSCADGGQAVACTTDADCAAGEQCGYAISLACGATPICGPTCAADCAFNKPECACDGTTTFVDCCGMYSSKPVAYAGVCNPDGGL